MNRDPRSSGFVWQSARGPFTTLTPAQAAAFERDGAFVLEDAFTRAELDLVIAAIDPLEAAAEAALETKPNGRLGIARAGEITFAPHLVAHSATLAGFSRHPRLLGVARDLLGPDVRLYWDQLVYKKAGMAEEFPWHQDNGYTFVVPEQYLTCWVALTDATEANGCPWVVPGLHRHGTLVHRWTDLGFQCLDSAEGAVALPLRAGSVAVFSSLTPHRTGPNRTTATRKAYILQYAPAGAVMHPAGKGPVAADNAQWQYPVIVAGEPV